MRNRFHSSNLAARSAPTIVTAALLFALAPLGGASAHTLNTLYSFCSESNCPDGESPWAGVVMDQSGNLYGTASVGGKYDGGLVFELVPNADKSQYTEYVLHNFCTAANCAGGNDPRADLIMDVDGNLYGTTYFGGKYGGGAVFKLTHLANGWSLGVIQSFCSQTNCSDGDRPSTGLAYAGQASGAPWDEFSPLFGTTEGGGANGNGLAYQLLEDGSLWNYEVVHSFKASAQAESADPGPLLVDSSLNLYGVTHDGGKYGWGVLYKLAAETWKETILHNFCAPPHCTDGAGGAGRPVMDAAGNLFGATWYSKCENGGCGGSLIFERAAGGTYSVIYNFCSTAGCSDGEFPTGLILDAGGTLYGTTQDGGKGDEGTVFRLKYDKQDHQWMEKVLHSFCANAGNCEAGGTLYGTTQDGGKGDEGTIFRLKYDKQDHQWVEKVLHNFCANAGNCEAGVEPQAPPILDAGGNLYGTTSGGGPGGAGTVFELTP